MKKIIVTLLALLLVIGFFFWLEDNKKSKNKIIEKNQWGINALKVNETKNKFKLEGKGISIAILDTGIDYDHRDLDIKKV